MRAWVRFAVAALVGAGVTPVASRADDNPLPGIWLHVDYDNQGHAAGSLYVGFDRQGGYSLLLPVPLTGADGVTYTGHYRLLGDMRYEAKLDDYTPKQNCLQGNCYPIPQQEPLGIAFTCSYQPQPPSLLVIDCGRGQSATISSSRSISHGPTPMTRRLISTGSPFEAAYGYSRAVIDGDYVFVAGTTGYDYATMTMPDDPAAQARNCFATIAKVLADAGSGLEAVVRATYYVTDASYQEPVLKVCGEVLGAIRPAATILVVAGLLKPEIKVEIEVTASMSR